MVFWLSILKRKQERYVSAHGAKRPENILQMKQPRYMFARRGTDSMRALKSYHSMTIREILNSKKA